MVFDIFKNPYNIESYYGQLTLSFREWNQDKRERDGLFQFRAKVCRRKYFIPNLHGLSLLSPHQRSIQAVLLSPIP